MNKKKTYNQGPQYDKKPEIKNYRRVSGFKISRNVVIIASVISVIVLLLIFNPFTSTKDFNPFTSTKEKLVDTKWELSGYLDDNDSLIYEYVPASSNFVKYFFYIVLEDLNIFSTSYYFLTDNKYWIRSDPDTYIISKPKNPVFNKDICRKCNWEIRGDSIYLYITEKNKEKDNSVFKGKLNSKRNLIHGDRFVGRKIED